MIYINQKIGLEGTITENGTAVDISSGEVNVDYWLPGNITSTPDGELSGTVLDGSAGTWEGEFPAELNALSGTLRVQAKATVNGDTYRAETTCETIYPIGSGC